MMRMFCSCPEPVILWKAVSAALIEVAGRTDVCTLEGSLLGLFKHPKAAHSH